MLKDMRPSAYDLAKSGGDYAKFYERYKGEYLPRLQRAERSYRRVIAEHEGYIRDPMSKLKPGLSAEEIRRYVEKKWPEDIARNTAYLEIITGIIAERTT
ncbi:hypothetical protein [Allochromatium palmeri]|uniref:Uncharacterized protein n=1 Tax=Allochromatium palmeri TaxID=231048 RepID=A0A6N8ECB0_9GAMM|nr:hypothetical protein [Allochromatium palmeri]MTW20529.1 hypothetical protein [Allochromatium palmeri]